MKSRKDFTKEEREAIGLRLKFARERAGMTQTQFSKLLGYQARPSYANAENGRVVPHESAFNMAEATFNLNKKWLKYGEGDMYLNDDPKTIEDYEAALKRCREEVGRLNKIIDGLLKR